MAGTSMLQVDARELDRVARALAGASLSIKGDVLEAVGSAVEVQVKERIENAGPAPDGSAWPAWSDAYAKTRHGDHDLLVNEGELLDSIQYAITGASVDVGSNLVYAATHQYGDSSRNIPQRALLGLSAENERDIESLVESICSGALDA